MQHRGRAGSARRIWMSCWRSLLALGCLGVVSFSNVWPLRAAEIILYGDDHQVPFVGPDEAPGLFREATEEMLRRAALPYTVVLTPWRRAQAELKAGGGGLIMNLARSPAREADFLWLVKILPTPYVMVSPGRVYDRLQDACDDGVVIALAGTPRAEEATAVCGAERVIAVNDPQQAVRLLQGGRAVAWYEIDLRAIHAWRSAGYPPEALKIGRHQQIFDSYLAASLTVPDAEGLQTRLANAFATMQADGTWEAILASYVGQDQAHTVAARTDR